MSIKMIATDLDGTLMSPDHLTITERTKAALKQAHDLGIRLALCTGRPMCIIGDVVEQVPFVDYIIHSNGASVYDRNNNKPVYESLIPNDVACELIDFVLQYEVSFDVTVNGESHLQKGTEVYFDSMIFPTEFIQSVSESMIAHDDLKAFLDGRGIEKITLYTVKDEDFDELWSKIESKNLFVATSFKGNIEATSINADKGKALKGVCDSLGIEAREVMAFGDAGNDCPMLEYALYSFAMGNATDECKSSARFETDTNGEDGVAVQIERYCL